MSEALSAWHWLVGILFGRPEVDENPPKRDDHWWQTAISTANLSLVTALLWDRLERQPALTAGLGEPEREYLAAFHELTESRNASIVEQLTRILALLEARGIAAMPIKGAAYLIEDLGDARVRHMTDIDLLLAAGDADRAREILIGAGYVDAPVTLTAGRDHHHLLPLIHSSQPAPVELHTDIVPAYLSATLSGAEVWARARTISRDGLEIPVPHPTDQAAVSFLHAELVDFGTALGLIPLRQFCDLAMLQNAFGESIDWAEIRDRAARCGGATRLKRYAYVYGRLSGRRLMPGQPYSLLDRLSYRLSLAAMDRPWIGAWRRRAHRFSSARLRRKYRLTGGFMALNTARLREAGLWLGSAVSPDRAERSE